MEDEENGFILLPSNLHLPFRRRKLITSAEWRVMHVLWEADRPLGSREIASALKERWHRQTVTTLLSRLERKDLIGFTLLGRNRYRGGFQYFALKSAFECALLAGESLLFDLVLGFHVRSFWEIIDDCGADSQTRRRLKKLLEEEEEPQKPKRRSAAAGGIHPKED